MNPRLTSIGVVLRKDLQIFWPLALPIAALLLISPWFAGAAQLDLFFTRFSLVDSSAVVAPFLFALALAHADPSASTRDDWLARPIRRLDMVAAKALFLVATVFLPWVLGDMIHLLVEDKRSLGEALLAASGKSMTLLLLALILSLAAVTANFVEAAVVLFVLAMVGVGLGLLGARWQLHFPGSHSIIGPGRIWPIPWLLMVGMVGAGGLAIWLQYGPRRTWAARSALLGAVLLAGLILAVRPLGPAGAGGKVESEVALDEASVCAMPIQTPRADMPFLDMLAISFNWSGGEMKAAADSADHIPQVVITHTGLAGLPAGWSAQIEQLDARFGGSASGSAIPFGGTSGISPSTPGVVVSSWLTSHRDRDLLRQPGASVDLDASLVLFRPARSYKLLADGKRRHVRGVGYCSVERRGRNDVVQCLTGWPAPRLLTAHLASRPDVCQVNCFDGVQHALVPALAQLPATKNFRILLQEDAPPLAKDEEVILTVHRPAGHLKRSISIAGPVGACVPELATPAPPVGRTAPS